MVTELSLFTHHVYNTVFMLTGDVPGGSLLSAALHSFSHSESSTGERLPAVVKALGERWGWESRTGFDSEPVPTDHFYPELYASSVINSS